MGKQKPEPIKCFLKSPGKDNLPKWVRKQSSASVAIRRVIIETSAIRKTRLSVRSAGARDISRKLVGRFQHLSRGPDPVPGTG